MKGHPEEDHKGWPSADDRLGTMLRQRIGKKRIVERTFAAAMPLLFPDWTRNACHRAGLVRTPDADPAVKFDLPHYSRMAGRSFRSIEAGLFHYLVVGGKMDWEPREGFSPRQYLQKNPDVLAAQYEPFAHYCRFGHLEGRDRTSGEEEACGADLAVLLVEMLSTRRPLKPRPVVDVVVPVYGNRALALRTIHSVLSAEVASPFELIVLDDASPDPMLADDLRALAAAGLITLIVHHRNLGFVQSANRGLMLHRDRDVVLLNSDTRVFGDWLDRLLTTLHAAPDIGTATPLSNAATILSYPITLRDNAMEPRHASAIDHLGKGLTAPPIDIPTAVGFCMGIRRKCLDQVGIFDVREFGRGYGEENDFCMRATRLGWRHVAAANVLVWHKAGASFGAERDMRIEQAQTVLRRLHPGYHPAVQRFIEGDFLKDVRCKLDAARVAFDPRPKVLELNTERQSLCPPKGLAVRLVPDIGRFYGQKRVVVPQLSPLPNLHKLNDNSPDQLLVGVLIDLGIKSVYTSSDRTCASALERRLIAAARHRDIAVSEALPDF